MYFMAGVRSAGMSANFLQVEEAYSSDAKASGAPIRWTFVNYSRFVSYSVQSHRMGVVSV